MIDREAELPINRQAQLLGISRGTVYYHPEPIPEAETALMRRIDELRLELPLADSRTLRDFHGLPLGRPVRALELPHKSGETCLRLSDAPRATIKNSVTVDCDDYCGK